MESSAVRMRGLRGGATQRAYDLADRHALLFRSRRRAAGNPRLATLTSHSLLSLTFLLVRFLNARRLQRARDTPAAKAAVFFSFARAWFVTAECRVRSRLFSATYSSNRKSIRSFWREMRITALLFLGVLDICERC